jgi:hypothetical protein
MYVVIFFSNQDKLNTNLTAKSQQVQKLKILKTKELHWKQTQSDWKIYTTVISYFGSNG